MDQQETLPSGGQEEPAGLAGSSEDDVSSSPSTQASLPGSRKMVRKLTTEALVRAPNTGPTSPPGGEVPPSGANNFKEKVAQLHARRSSYGASQAPRWEGLEGVKLADRIQGLSASLSAAPTTIGERVALSW